MEEVEVYLNKKELQVISASLKRSIKFFEGNDINVKDLAHHFDDVIQEIEEKESIDREARQWLGK